IRDFHVTGVQTCAVPILGGTFWNQPSSIATVVVGAKRLKGLLAVPRPRGGRGTDMGGLHKLYIYTVYGDSSCDQSDSAGRCVCRSEERRVGTEGGTRWSR